MSSILCLFRNSWVSIWILLELNTLAFCSASMTTSLGRKKKIKENIMKYLIIQSTASALLIRIYIISKERREISKVFFLIIAIRLLIKIAAAPFYQWLIKITKGISWSQNIILLTWQKLAPVYLLIFQSSHIFVIAVPLSALLGAALILNKTNVKEIFGLSSLFNLRWIMISIIFRLKIYLIFFLIYSVVNATALIVFWKRNQENLTEKNLNTIRKETTLVLMARLAGIPPLLGFLMKWMVLEKIAQNKIKTIPVFLLIVRAINLYIYLRIINPNLISNSHDSQKKAKKRTTLMKAGIFFYKYYSTQNNLSAPSVHF